MKQLGPRFLCLDGGSVYAVEARSASDPGCQRAWCPIGYFDITTLVIGT